MDDYVVLVTGASGGVGSSIASELLRGGAEVMLLGRSAARLKAAFPSGDLGMERFLVADLTDAIAIEKAGKTIMERGRLDA